MMTKQQKLSKVTRHYEKNSFKIFEPFPTCKLVCINIDQNFYGKTKKHIRIDHKIGRLKGVPPQTIEIVHRQKIRSKWNGEYVIFTKYW